MWFSNFFVFLSLIPVKKGNGMNVNELQKKVSELFNIFNIYIFIYTNIKKHANIYFAHC